MKQGTKLKSEHAKRFLLPLAIRHYLTQSETYCFMSLYDDNEPFPLSEVIALQQDKVAQIAMEQREAERLAEIGMENLQKLDAAVHNTKSQEVYLALDKARFLAKELGKAKEILERLQYREREIAKKTLSRR